MSNGDTMLEAIIGKLCQLVEGVGVGGQSSHMWDDLLVFCDGYQTLRTSPAMAAGVTKRLWEMSDVVDVLEAWEASSSAA